MQLSAINIDSDDDHTSEKGANPNPRMEVMISTMSMKKAKTASKRHVEHDVRRARKAKAAEYEVKEQVKIYNDLITTESKVAMDQKSKSVAPTSMGKMSKTGSLAPIDIKAGLLSPSEGEEKLSAEELKKIQESVAYLKKTELTDKTVRVDNASCWEYLHFTWISDIIEKANKGEKITLDDLGGMTMDQTLKHRTKLLEDVYEGQPRDNKNIFLACLTAFWPLFVKGSIMVTIQWALFFWKTKAMKDVTAYIEDIQNVDVNQGIWLLSSVFIQLIFQNYFEEHTFTINFHCGHAFQQSVDALIMKKMLRLTAATSKNYETGQIHAIKGCSHRLIWLVWELNHLMMLPINIVTFSFYLYYLVGVSFVFGMSLLGICFFVDRRFRDAMHELHFENGKLNEKKSNLTNEAFESIRAIKLYGWDEYFHKEIVQKLEESKEKVETIRGFEMQLRFMWCTLPGLVSPLTFTLFMCSGSSLNFSDMMEAIMLMNRLQGCMHHVNHLQEQLADLRITSRRIQEYLGQPEAAPKQEVAKKAAHPEYAVYIENQNYTWGVQTIDVDDMFDKMGMEMRGETKESRDAKKTQQQLIEENERRLEKQKNMAQARKLEKIVCLKNITVKIPKGQFVCIIGKVGSGKSSLLSTMCGELLPISDEIINRFKGDKDMDKELSEQEIFALNDDLLAHYAKTGSGATEVNGSLAYTQQQPWIRNKTIRQNIIYNLPFEHEKYVDTVQYSEFERDICMQKKGDKTLVGDRGVTLSGGQKARLGLARALYQDKEIYLMDDPISALDAHVRGQIINNIYFGVLKDRTRILVTHAVDFLPKADHIIMMDEGRILAQGSFDEMNKIKEFQEVMSINDLNKNLDDDDKNSAKGSAEGDTETVSEEDEEEVTGDAQEAMNMVKKNSSARASIKKEKSLRKSKSKKGDALADLVKEEESSEVDEGDEGANEEEEKLVEIKYPSKLTSDEKWARIGRFQTKQEKKKKDDNEEDDKNDLKDESSDDDDKDNQKDSKVEVLTWETIYQMTTYFDYKVCAVYLLTQVAINQMEVYCQHFLGEWSQDPTMNQGFDNIMRAAGWYVILRMVTAFFNVLDVKSFWMLTGEVSDTLKKQLLNKIMNAPTSFFDTTPHETVMSRFNEDSGKLIGIVHTLSFAIDQTIRVGTTLYLICKVNPLCLIGVAIFCFMVRNTLSGSAKAQKAIHRLLSEIRNGVRVNQGEIMSGGATIRAVGSSEFATKVNEEGQDSYNLTNFVVHGALQWLSMQARYATMVLVFVGCANVIMSKVNGVTDIIMTTLLLQRMVELGGVFIGVLHRVTSFEREGLGVQKCFKILTIDQENKTQPRHPDKTWPQTGAIKASNVLLRYTKNSELVLKGLNVNIKGGEKVGIVGRTGAGKSTLANAVTRIVEICGGTIEFDGVDIGKINLDQVRESITIIPQDPTLFKGTIKFNMDPTGKCTDQEIEKVLKDAELDKLIFKKKEDAEKEKKEKMDKIENKELLAKAKVEEEASGLLDFKIDAGGGNLSSGEKALICICRAILRKTNIVILDEATATIDLKTEQQIQKLIDSSFKNCTMLVIAHRLQTIIKSDKVLVLGAGLKKEFGAPQKLLKNPKSNFSKLCNRMKAAEEKEDEKKKAEAEKDDKDKKE